MSTPLDDFIVGRDRRKVYHRWSASWAEFVAGSGGVIMHRAPDCNMDDVTFAKCASEAAALNGIDITLRIEPPTDPAFPSEFIRCKANAFGRSHGGRWMPMRVEDDGGKLSFSDPSGIAILPPGEWRYVSREIDEDEMKRADPSRAWHHINHNDQMRRELFERGETVIWREKPAT